ncbi:MAG: type II toxin-antitoxin system RelE/ParE family toxin [Bacteroidales bacterium]|nr:type II toxin-antitoxin system RelE/ParE family toxin [Bacteroidales bacterium]
MKTEFLSRFYKDLDKLPSQSVKNDVFNAIINVEKSLKISQISNIKKLTGYSFSYRIRIGNYRIGVFIENDIVQFARVLHRKDIYKAFP